MPLFLRISATDWLDEVAKTNPDAPQESWTIEETVKLAPILAELGVDVLDVSSGGNHPLQHPHAGPAYQAPFSKKIKEAVGDKMIVTAVGNITTGPQANQLLEEGLDAIFCGRTFQKDPCQYCVNQAHITVLTPF
jgi:2,4-dienoyl-CoA reductase-like NADH-dependent reductase (Old Yellow Enzyme family)